MSTPRMLDRRAGPSPAPPTSPAGRRLESVRRSIEAEGLGTVIPFLDAVAQQTGRLEPGDEGWADRELVRFARAHMLLAAALLAHGDQSAIDAPARALLDDPPLYAAFVQNVDLLYAVRSPAADPVAYLLGAALDR